MKSNSRIRMLLAKMAFGAGVTCLLGMVPQAPATIGYGQLTSVNAQGQCTIRPSSSSRAIYNAMSAGRISGKAPPAEVLYHAANRLGYGLAPFGPLTVRKAN